MSVDLISNKLLPTTNIDLLRQKRGTQKTFSQIWVDNTSSEILNITEEVGSYQNTDIIGHIIATFVNELTDDITKVGISFPTNVDIQQELEGFEEKSNLGLILNFYSNYRIYTSNLIGRIKTGEYIKKGVKFTIYTSLIGDDNPEHLRQRITESMNNFPKIFVIRKELKSN